MKAERATGVRRPHVPALVVVLLASLVAGGGASGATTAPTFARADYPLFGNNYVAGDFNGDGSLDLAGAGGPSAAVRLNNGAGTFGARVDYPVGGPGQDLAAGDFNGDGRLDLVVTINDPQIGLSLLTGNGDGTFGAVYRSAPCCVSRAMRAPGVSDAACPHLRGLGGCRDGIDLDAG